MIFHLHNLSYEPKCEKLLKTKYQWWFGGNLNQEPFTPDSGALNTQPPSQLGEIFVCFDTGKDSGVYLVRVVYVIYDSLFLS